MPSASSPVPISSYITLQTGRIVRIEAILLADDLAVRGIRLQRDGDDILIGPSSYLTDEDRASVRLWKQHILAVLDCLERRAVQ
jgi:hypothetical protein